MFEVICILCQYPCKYKPGFGFQGILINNVIFNFNVNYGLIKAGISVLIKFVNIEKNFFMIVPCTVIVQKGFSPENKVPSNSPSLYSVGIVTIELLSEAVVLVELPLILLILPELLEEFTILLTTSSSSASLFMPSSASLFLLSSASLFLPSSAPLSASSASLLSPSSASLFLPSSTFLFLSSSPASHASSN